ncbi:MAG: hypothetical protein WAN65_10350 [Candidatus Sulfotelmatobacter sp.]
MRRREIEENRRAQEFREKQEKERIDDLIQQASHLHRSETIRNYVQAVHCRRAELAANSADLETWAAWALKEADRIDPVKNGVVRTAVELVVQASKQTQHTIL